MSRQQIDHQLAFIRCELTRIAHELAFTEEKQAQALIVRQSRLSAELQRLESLLRDGVAAESPSPR